MRFADLYNHAASLAGPVVRVQHDLAPYIKLHHGAVGEVNFWEVDLDPEISFGHLVFEYDRSSAYGEEYAIANIRFCEGLNRCWRRFVACKELMHVFDRDDERVTSRERFLQLMHELETRPLYGDMSRMLTSEHEAMWKALTVLCPKPRRDEFMQRWTEKSIGAYDIAVHFLIPADCVSALMGPYYDDVLAKLLSEA